MSPEGRPAAEAAPFTVRVAPGPLVPRLLSRLRAAGLPVGVTEELRIAAVLPALLADGDVPDGRLAAALRCIVVRSPAHAERFAEAYAAWLAEVLPAAPAETDEQPPDLRGGPRGPGGGTSPGTARPGRWRRLASLVRRLRRRLRGGLRLGLPLLVLAALCLLPGDGRRARWSGTSRIGTDASAADRVELPGPVGAWPLSYPRPARYGTIVARLTRRGGSEETFTAHGGAVLGSQPLLVLTNGETASGAELLAAALQAGRGAQIVGQKTLGKWSVQTIETLHNGYALKFTSSGFRTAAGKSFEGQGLTPDVEVALDPKQAERLLRVRDPERRLAEDVQLRTAANLLKLLAR